MASPKPSTTDTFYQQSLLLEALDPTRGERSKSGTLDDATADHPSVRRSFVDHIAYICAYNKGPPYVTAAALEQTSQGITVWLAGNQNVKQEAVDFLASVLNDLSGIARLNRGNVVDQAELLATGKLSSSIIKFLRSRLLIYYNKSLKKHIPQCLGVIDIALNQGPKENTDIRRLTALQEWLKKFSQHNAIDPCEAELEALVQDCYNVKRSNYVSCFKLLGAQGQAGYKDFQGIYKLLGKLGQPIVAARSFVAAALTLPVDFVEGFKIEVVPSSAYQKVPLFQNVTIGEIVSKVFKSRDKQKKYQERLGKLTDKESLSDALQKKCKLETVVHAELLILNHFYSQGYEFVARDKYIACSKHACYLCHAYIKYHPGNFTPPPTHHKIYKGWRAPNADSKDLSLVALDDEIVQLMNGQLQGDLLAEIDSCKPRRSLRADSPPS